MPSLHTLFVVDAEGFSRHRDAELPDLHTEIREAIARACEHSGLGETWQTVRFLQSTGDGVLAVLPLAAAAPLIDPFIHRLQAVLAEAAPRLRARELRLRLRVALHIGLVDDADPVTAGVSTAAIDVNRLLDCSPLRTTLRDSDPDVTFTALIVSSTAFEMFVRGGHTGLRPSQFTKVRAQVKGFDQPAFVYVPTPSRVERTADAPAPQTGSSSPTASTFANTARDHSQVTVQGIVHGSVHQIGRAEEDDEE